MAEEIKLDPNNPKDAVMIIEVLTREITLSRSNAQALIQSLNTLSEFVNKNKTDIKDEISS